MAKNLFNPAVSYTAIPQEPQVEGKQVRNPAQTRLRISFLLFLALYSIICSIIIFHQAFGPPSWSYPSNAVCERPGFRREWRVMRERERKDYIDAVKCLQGKPSKLGTNRSLYEDFPYAHGLGAGDGVHEAATFLPWHRYFVHIYEQTLRNDCEYTGAFPYWDWTLDWKNLSLAPVFGDNDMAFGTDGLPGASIAPSVQRGYCVMDGPFAGLTLQYFMRRPLLHCLSRHFSTNDTEMQIFRDWLSPDTIETLFEEEEYEKFNIGLEHAAHLAIPGFMSGEMATFTAPNDPIFFLHHAQLDRLWWRWQRQSPSRMTRYQGERYRDAPKFEKSAGMEDVLHMGGLAPDIEVYQIMDTQKGPLCYTYT